MGRMLALVRFDGLLSKPLPPASQKKLSSSVRRFSMVRIQASLAEVHPPPQLQTQEWSAVEKLTPKTVSYGRAVLSAPATRDPHVLSKELSNEPQLSSSLAAIDAEQPDGAKDLTVLQKHVAYFDRNQDGVVYPNETYEAFRALGYGRVLSTFAGLLINAALSYPTYDNWIPDPLLPVYVESINRTKHGSDTDVYDREGRFVDQKFEDIFKKYASQPDKMTYEEIVRMTEARRLLNDPFGWNAAKAEWYLTWDLAKDEEGFASKEAIRGVYDGSFFYYIENKLKNT